MKNDILELFDLNDKKVGEVEMSPRAENAGPRKVIFRGRRFIEGGAEGSFYGANQCGEVTDGYESQG